MKSLFTCQVFTIKGHACISLNMKLNLIITHDNNFSFYDPENDINIGLSTSMIMRHMYEQMKKTDIEMKTKFGYILLWFDSFQVHQEQTFNNLIWILTFTMSQSKTSTVKIHTYIIVIGLKGWGYTPVTSHYMKEL